MAPSSKPGIVRRFFHWLFSPSARLSVFALMLMGLVVGAVGVVGTQVAVAMTGTNDFCGSACHSHTKFVYPEFKASVHASNRSGVQASCGDCHIPHSYPAKLIYKAKAGIRDGIAEMQGVISTREKFEAKRWEMANHVWDEMRANNSANCRSCHTPEAMNNAKQSEDAVKQHKKFTSGKATCIDCHTGVAHKEPEEPKAPTSPAAAAPAAPPASK
jgi:nitrate/TMAO reductase-like tetraheme cytochrome c subunit